MNATILAKVWKGEKLRLCGIMNNEELINEICIMLRKLNDEQALYTIYAFVSHYTRKKD